MAIATILSGQFMTAGALYGYSFTGVTVGVLALGNATLVRDSRRTIIERPQPKEG